MQVQLNALFTRIQRTKPAEEKEGKGGEIYASSKSTLISWKISIRTRVCGFPFK